MKSAWTRDRLIRRWRRMVIGASWKVGGKPRLFALLSRGSAAFAAGCAAILLISAPGCATTPKAAALPSQDVRASLGRIGVISVGPALSGTVSGPVGVGREIGRGALRGGALGGLGAAGTGALLGLTCGPCAPACVPLFAVAGGVGGLVIGSGTGAVIHGVYAIPESTAMTIEAGLTSVVGGGDPQSELRARVVRVGGAGVALDLGMGGPDDLTAQPDYKLFVARGIDTVLEVAIAQIVLGGEGGRDPALVLAISARARLVRVADNRVLWSDDQLTYRSPAKDFSVWSADDYAALKLEFENGLDTLARDIAGKVFGIGIYAARSG